MMILLIFIITVFFSSLLGFFSRGVTFTSPDGQTDAEQQVKSAAHSMEWRWPADIHKYTVGKTVMKHVSLVLLAIVQRLTQDRKGFFPVFLVSNLANLFSTLLIFLIASAYWDHVVATVVATLYLFCVWPVMIVLLGGFQVVSLLFTLLAIFCLQQTGLSSIFPNCGYVVSAIFLGLAQFSSASNRKFIPIFIAAFLYAQKDTADLFWFYPIGNIANATYPSIINICLFCISIICLAAFRTLYRPFFTAVYFDRIPQWLNWIKLGKLKNRSPLPIDEYLSRAKAYVMDLFSIGRYIAIWLLISIMLFNDIEFFIRQSIFLASFIIVVVYLNWPNPISNLSNYYNYSISERWGNHHYHHRKYYQEKKIEDPDNIYGGILWEIRFFWRMIPIHFILYVLSIVFLLTHLIPSQTLQGSLTYLMIIGLSVSGIILGRTSKGPHSATAYFPTLIGLLIPICFAISLVQIEYGNSLLLWFPIGSLMIASVLWNIHQIFVDVLPSRLRIKHLSEILKDHSITQFYTYRTEYNKPFVDLLLYSYPNTYDVSYIDTLNDVVDGYVVIPATGVHSLDFESSASVIEQGDFSQDPILTELIFSTAMENICLSKFKTFGWSRYWNLVSSDMGYKDLLFHDITSIDRLRGYAWIIHSDEVKQFIENR